MNIPDHFSESLVTVYKVKNSLMQIRDIFDPGSGMEMQIRGPGSGINICIDRTDLARSALIKAYHPNETIPYPGNQC
jgi:hypothetical protein